MFPTKCPKCGARIVYSFGTSYYLRCERDYYCWNEHCTKSDALHYPEYISNYDMSIVEGIQESIENGDDYYHHPY